MFNYPEESFIHDKIILEVNSFSNPTPVESVELVTLVGKYIGENFGIDDQKTTGLLPFNVTALSVERAFCEKLLALRRASAKGGEFFENRVRHVYDIWELWGTERIKQFVKNGQEFENMLIQCHSDDQLNQKISNDVDNSFTYFEVFKNPQSVLESVSVSYNGLKSITFDRSLPSIDEVSPTFTDIGNRLKEFRF